MAEQWGKAIKRAGFFPKEAERPIWEAFIHQARRAGVFISSYLIEANLHFRNLSNSEDLKQLNVANSNGDEYKVFFVRKDSPMDVLTLKIDGKSNKQTKKSKQVMIYFTESDLYFWEGFEAEAEKSGLKIFDYVLEGAWHYWFLEQKPNLEFIEIPIKGVVYKVYGVRKTTLKSETNF